MYDCHTTANKPTTTACDCGWMYVKVNAVTSGQYRQLRGMLCGTVPHTRSTAPPTPSPSSSAWAAKKYTLNSGAQTSWLTATLAPVESAVEE